MERSYLDDLEYDDELLEVLLLDVCLCGLLVLLLVADGLLPDDDGDDGLLGEDGRLGCLVGVGPVLGLLVVVGTVISVVADGGLVVGRVVIVGACVGVIPAGELVEEEAGQNSSRAGSSLSNMVQANSSPTSTTKTSSSMPSLHSMVYVHMTRFLTISPLSVEATNIKMTPPGTNSN